MDRLFEKALHDSKRAKHVGYQAADVYFEQISMNTRGYCVLYNGPFYRSKTALEKKPFPR